MQVTNATRSAVNYKGKAFGPGAVITLADGAEKNGSIARMLEDGRLTVNLGESKPAAKADAPAKK
jgi:hypothetical protein